MAVIVDLDPGARETLKAALGGGGDRAHIGRRPATPPRDRTSSEDCVVLGPAVDQATALRARGGPCGSRGRASGVVLVRRRIDTGVLGDALRAGVREVVEERDLVRADTRAVRRTRTLAPRAAGQRRRPPGRGRGRPARPGRHRVLRQGRLRQDHAGDQPGGRARRPRQARGLPGRPRPRLRRRRDRAAAVPLAHHRRRRPARRRPRRPGRRWRCSPRTPPG